MQAADGDDGSGDLFARRLEERVGGLSPTGRRIAHYISVNRAAAMASSAAELAAVTGTSDASVIRTAQMLGFSGLGELKKALVASARPPTDTAENMRRTLGEIGADVGRAVATVFEAHADAFEQLRSDEAQRRIRDAVEALHSLRRIVVFGIGPSAPLAAYVATLLRRAGQRCLVLDRTGSMLADQMLDLTAEDGLLVLAYGRAYPEVVAVFGEANRLGIPIVLVTDSLERKLARRAAVTLPASRGRAERVALHGATLVCLEAVVLGLAAVSRTDAMAASDRLEALRTAVRDSSHE